LSWVEFFAVVAADLRFRRGVQDAEYLNEKIDPSQDERRFGDYLTARALHRGNDGFRGDVAGAEVFGKKRSQHVVIRFPASGPSYRDKVSPSC
jgi:hypothetical protein